jgi:hypothetical protein
MIDIKINITNKIANAIGTPFIVCGNSDYTVTFTFDAEWGAYQEKTARFFFVSDGIEQYIDVLFSGNTCNAPVLPNIEKVLIGVYTGNLRTTTGAEVRCKRSILFGGKVHEPPTTEDVYNEILEIVSKKLGSEGGTVTGDYYKDGNTFIHEGNLDLLDGTDNLAITKTASGSAITIDSANAPLQNLKLYGKTTQDGTPTPTEPKELKSVGDSGSFEVGVYGGNLLPYPYVEKSQTTKGLTINVDDKGIITINGIAEDGGSFCFANKPIYVNGNITISAIGGSVTTYHLIISYDNGRSATVATSSVTRAIQNSINSVNLYWVAGTVFNNVVIRPMINYGTTVLPYEPYNKQSITFTDTLRGVGDIADEKDFARGVTTQRFVKVVLNGSETWSATTSGSYAQLYNHSIITNAKKSSTIFGMCSHAPSVNKMINSNYLRITLASKGSGLLIHDTLGVWGLSENTELAFQNYLKAQYDNGTPITIIYELETPIETPLTETELNAYRQLYTNKPNTTILSEADMEVDYYINKPNAQAIGNIHSQVNKDYFKLQQAIISTGGNV